MNSTLRYIPIQLDSEEMYDLSPFHVRTTHDSEHPEKKHKKGVVILDPIDNASDNSAHSSKPNSSLPRKTPIQRWLQSQPKESELGAGFDEKGGATSASSFSNEAPIIYPDRTQSAQWTLDEWFRYSLTPFVTPDEAQEYELYVNHPLKLPLVGMSALAVESHPEYDDYIATTSTDAIGKLQVPEEDLFDYDSFIRISEDPLTVLPSETPKKKYKVYRQYLKGKSLFKHQRQDQAGK
jgi:hypothetical protein